MRSQIADLWLSSPSSTFHGRDIFAPVAAALASGTVKSEEIGPKLAKRSSYFRASRRNHIKPGQWQGKLLSIDRFGNAITNFSIAAFAKIAVVPLQPQHRQAPDHTDFELLSGMRRKGSVSRTSAAQATLKLAAKAAKRRSPAEAPRPGDCLSLRLLDLHK